MNVLLICVLYFIVIMNLLGNINGVKPVSGLSFNNCMERNWQVVFILQSAKFKH